ncbi:hypothetical protein [Pedobacter sp. Leaf194]|uniref:hypothetical protein n=1 Tax=Pedobacter sp. Leaf194 TaxID=1736297 RepID=UPI00070249DE|nr:hypothetical protein [Pedobacter sp. Leaf194]KQS40963.1 hypothetical protein ASG14_00285 [Pedobacter sp. Leaf194]
MKLPFAIFMVVTILSCNSQTKTDLLSLKLNSKVPAVVLQNNELKQDTDPNLGLAILNTAKLEKYAIGEIELNSYTFPNGNAADYSNLSILLSSKQRNNYLGFNYSSVNQQETKAIVAYLKKTYPAYQQSDTKGNGESYFWDVPKLDAWIFTYQGNSTDKNGKNFFSTNFIFVKRGTRMENSTDPKVITIMAYYKMMYPDVVK